jgi:hypothetical protein
VQRGGSGIGLGAELLVELAPAPFEYGQGTRAIAALHVHAHQCAVAHFTEWVQGDEVLGRRSAAQEVLVLMTGLQPSHQAACHASLHPFTRATQPGACFR